MTMINYANYIKYVFDIAAMGAEDHGDPEIAENIRGSSEDVILECNFWNSVADGLPELDDNNESDRVVLYSPMHEIMVGYIYDPEKDEDARWECGDYSYYVRDNIITHWMRVKLPED